ncbi:DUF350 domain-containing protein [Microbulbifer agarilyticus]
MPAAPPPGPRRQQGPGKAASTGRLAISTALAFPYIPKFIIHSGEYIKELFTKEQVDQSAYSPQNSLKKKLLACDLITAFSPLSESIKMQTEFLTATLFNLGLNLLYTILALLIGMVALLLIDKKLLKHVDIEGELKNGNVAVAIFASTILIFVAMIISFGLKG